MAEPRWEGEYQGPRLAVGKLLFMVNIGKTKIKPGRWISLMEGKGSLEKYLKGKLRKLSYEVGRGEERGKNHRVFSFLA